MTSRDQYDAEFRLAMADIQRLAEVVAGDGLDNSFGAVYRLRSMRDALLVAICAADFAAREDAA